MRPVLGRPAGLRLAEFGVRVRCRGSASTASPSTCTTRTTHRRTSRYGEHRAKISITTGMVIEGSLPRRAGRLVADWVEEHSAELAACWERASNGEEPGTIEPLR